MGSVAVTKAIDERFLAEIRALDRSDHWKRFAISGRMVGELASAWPSDGRPVHAMEQHYVGPAEDQRAWLWGYRWTPGGPPPVERPEGTCPECWRLGEPCSEHYEKGGGWPT